MWGLIGIHTDKFGFKNVWEIWHASSHFAFAFPDVGHVVGYIKRSTDLWFVRGTPIAKP